MSATATNANAQGLTVEVYVAQRRPQHEYGVAIYLGRRELIREEEFWTRQKADRAVDRLVAEAIEKLAQTDRLAA